MDKRDAIGYLGSPITLKSDQEPVITALKAAVAAKRIGVTTPIESPVLESQANGAAEPSSGPGSCNGLVDNPSIDKPIAACRANYGYGYLQGTNKTHLHWSWKMSGVGTPSCKDPANCTLMPEKDVPKSQLTDELWIIKDPRADPVLGEYTTPVGA